MTVVGIFGLLALMVVFGFIGGRPYSEDAITGSFALMGAVAGYTLGRNYSGKD
jgi:hypothetical protein